MVKPFGCMKQFCDLQLPIYILLCKLNYGYHNQALLHQYLPTEHISAVKIDMGYEINASFLVIPKSPKV